MTTCPRCQGDVVTDRDMYGEFESCLTCGWGGETMLEPPRDEPRAAKLPRYKRPKPYDIDPALYELGAPRPHPNDFLTRREYLRTYHRWRYYNVRKTQGAAL